MFKLNQQIIRDRCGDVSFKRGEAFYRNGKVFFKEISSNYIHAIVRAAEDFHVTIEKKDKGSIHTDCSCPKLASFQKECQHVAAALLALYEYEQGDSTKELQSDMLTKGLLNLFEDKQVHSSGQQLHFEKRTVLDAEFICSPVQVDQDQYMFGIELEINGTGVQRIRDFLQAVQKGIRTLLSLTFTYDPALHCLSNDADQIIQQLIQVNRDEKAYLDAMPQVYHAENNPGMLLIPPSSWEKLEPLLTKASTVNLRYDGKSYDGLILVDETPPLNFYFKEAGQSGYQLEVKGLHSMVLLFAYRTAIMDGKLLVLKDEENQRLHELKQMLAASGTNQIPIPAEQMKYFMEKVVPGLRKMGNVHLSHSVINRFETTPLSAKLYLDRLKDRLLAGIEFHYENMIIDPFEAEEKHGGLMIVRDTEKEKKILELMDESSFVKTDGGYFLQNEELEYHFLYHVLPELQQLVQVYATTAVRTRIIKNPARPKIRIKHKRERTDWLEFKFEMAGIPEQEIRDLLWAIEEKRKYYRLRDGTLMSLEAREMEEIRQFLLAAPVQDEDLEQGLEVPLVKGLQLIDAVADTDTFSIEDSFRTFIKKISNPGNMTFAVPKGLDLILRDYQKQGFRWMKTLASYGFGGILADDMGLGKTLQSIAFIDSELTEIRTSKLPVLIVCPSSVTYNWLHELKKFVPEIRATVVDGDVAARRKLQRDLAGIDAMITSYPMLRSDIDWFGRQQFHTVFFDEAQAFKNPTTQTARAVKKVQARNRFALTGTPVENQLEELWSIFHVVFPELFGGLKDYSNLSRGKISRRIRPFMLRRVKEDVLKELPDKLETTESVELLPEQKKLYAAYLAKLRHDTLKHLNKETIRKNKIRILAGLTRLRQICCHPALFVDGYKGSSAKLVQLLQIMEEARKSGRRVLIFSQFTKMLEIIGRELANQGRPFFYLDGKTPSEERVETCNRFNDGERDVFLISLKAGGTGLNLTGADTVILYDLWWNPAVEEQAADRAHRMGQQHTVQVIKLLARGTIEEKMNDLQEKKRNLIEEIIESDEKSQPTLTEEDIQELLGACHSPN
ncbi:DEAD/DEAH box helicase [Oceanobacillus massiliensis]|uniref:DEAD/DEAH box helicase n=1 Tax=Oceanobacillus massiliensis TaxID=1465765 RepID=UPI00301A5949